jgi:2-C-methyl-D-erythritol 4-phosphate cytidylyltransferase
MVAAIIVAGGQGLRMKSPIRKQYLPLAGLPILTHTLTVFDNCDLIGKIFLVAPEDDFDFCRKTILAPLKSAPSIQLVTGGARRQESVYNGLLQVEPDCDIVVIHDGVRPLVRSDQLGACIDGARKYGACILGIPAYDTLKQVDQSDNIVKTVAREAIWLAQTPQAFRYDLIRKAHDRARFEGYLGTDDASLIERAGGAVKILQGSRNNIKITNTEDIRIAQAIIESDKGRQVTESDDR